MKKQLNRIEAKLDEILRVETQLLKNTANVNGSKGLLQTIQAWSDSENGVCLSERGELVYDGTQSIEPAQDIIINNLPSKPDWSTAPEWANWLFKDSYSLWTWSKYKLAIIDNYWFITGKYEIARCDNYEDLNWKDSLHQRPKSEQITITANLNADTDGYLAGKKSFITAYVDLLLARMAHTQSFSDDDELVTFFEAFDVITFEDTGGRRKNYGVIAIQSPTPTGKICITHNIAKKDNEWVLLGSEEFGTREFNFRTITELEAVEFRAAMEAVYG